MGTLMVPLPYLLRGQLGRVGAFAAAVALAFGPTYLYYSRFAREDIYIACITLALLVVTFRFLDRPRAHQPALIGALLALSFATKETTFITVFVAGTFFLVALALQARRHGFRDAPLVRAVAAVGWEAWAWALAAFVARLHAAVHRLPHRTPAGSGTASTTGLDYWLAQHGPGRGEKEWYFYFVVLFAEEWPALLLGAVGAVATLRRPTLLRAFLIWDFVLSLAVYSWANERFSWLVHAPAAAAAAAGRPRRPGDLGRAHGAGPGGSGSRVVRRLRAARGLRVVVGRTSRTAPTRASSSSRRSRPSRSRACATRSSRSPARARREGREPHVVVDTARARRSRGRGTSATSTPATSTSRTRRCPPTRDVAILTEADRERAARRARRLRRPRVPVPRLVGARLRRDVAGRLVALVHAARAVEPDGRPARVALRAPGRLTASRLSVEPPHGRAVARRSTRSPELVPLRDAAVAVVRALERPDDDVADPVAVEQLPRRRRVVGDS